ncbi:hypothetical protein DM53_4523 [Burkholderia mallei]|nr:hypothetical protein DM53_4523 [Burkholderia mallei]
MRPARAHRRRRNMAEAWPKRHRRSRRRRADRRAPHRQHFVTCDVRIRMRPAGKIAGLT